MPSQAQALALSTIGQALLQAHCLRAVSVTWRLDSELLLADVLGVRREHLLAHPEDEIPTAAQRRYRDFIRRRLAGEPVAYILGRKYFRDFELSVDETVLIPRPETELLIEALLDASAERPQQACTVADLGTGSGAIAIAIARERPEWQVLAVDISEQALAMARLNAERLAPGRIAFSPGSWCEGLPDNSCDVICANPPYIAAGDSHLLEDGLPFEPELALIGGVDGLRDLSAIIDQSPRVLRQDGRLYVEHGLDQAAAVRELLQLGGFSRVHSHRDYAGHERFTVAALEQGP